MKLLYCIFYFNIFLMTLNRVKLARLVTFIKYTASIVRLTFWRRLFPKVFNNAPTPTELASLETLKIDSK